MREKGGEERGKGIGIVVDRCRDKKPTSLRKGYRIRPLPLARAFDINVRGVRAGDPQGAVPSIFRK